MSATTTAPAQLNGNSAQLNGNSAQYAVKKRRRPQPKKDKLLEEGPLKSNPSKRHRDRLNYELDELSQLIPFPADVLEKLDKLSILRLVVSYLRNKNYHAAEKSLTLENDLTQLLPSSQDNQVACLQESESKLALEALHGFLIVVNQDFTIFYVTESVQDYLGFPQSDMMNLSMLDFVHVEDREIFKMQMRINDKESQTPEDDSVPEYIKMSFSPEWFRGLSQDGLMHRSFICRLRCLPDTSSGFLALHFTGHLRLILGQNRSNDQKIRMPPEVGLFLLASPLQSPSILEIRTKNFIFRTKHKLDYTPLGIDAKGKIVLGYTDEQMKQRSGYEFIHSADMMHCADAHTKLMRLGESGYTVFRLLHKDNHWIWVTASSRLVYRNGKPDCIIATQKPIHDEEGKEHMKKRSNAFRFDFTGHAILYGEVNPIGIRGGPENNPLSDEPPDQPPISKRQRITDPNEVDRNSLFGAQSMQRMDIYMGNLPNQPSDTFTKRPVQASAGIVQNLMKNEQLGDCFGTLTADSKTAFFPIGTELTKEQKEHAMRQRFCNPNSSVPPTTNMYQEQSYNNVQPHHVASLDSLMSSIPVQEPPRLFHPPHNQDSSADTVHFQKSNILKRPYPDTPNPAAVSFQLQQGQSHVSQNQFTMPVAETQFSNIQSNFQYENQFTPQPQQQNFMTRRVPTNQDIHNQPTSSNMYSQIPQPMLQLDNSANIDIHQNLNGIVEPSQFTQRNSLQPSILPSMTINSVIDLQQQQNQTHGSVSSMSQGMEENLMLPVPDDFDVPQLIGVQNNTIRIDLDKVAIDYQTTNPLSAVQRYMSDNPSHAAAIASGMIPEKIGFVNPQSSNNKSNFVSNYQRQILQHQGKTLEHQQHMEENLPILNPNENYFIPSVSSNSSMSVGSEDAGKTLNFY